MDINKRTIIIKSILILTCALSLNTKVIAQITENSCTVSPTNPPSGNTSRLKRELQRATNTGKKVTITGQFTITKPILIAIRRDLKVDATKASFTAGKGLDGDMISLDIITTSSDRCRYSNGRLANIEWKGGSFQFTDAKNSKTVPIQPLVPKTRQGTAKTGDALSIRGVAGDGSTQRINTATIDDVMMRGTTGTGKNFDDAGGDSGVFISSVKHGIVKNSEFYGIRDAAIYVSANKSIDTIRSQYTLENNIIKRVYDGISSKRGADNIVMRGNEITDSVVALSIKENKAGRLASKINIEDNTITRSVRSILLENTRAAKVNNNKILEMGGSIAGKNSPLSGNGRYRGVILDGLSGTGNEVNGNTFKGIRDPKNERKTVAISSTVRNGKANASFERKNNNYNNIDERLRKE